MYVVHVFNGYAHARGMHAYHACKGYCVRRLHCVQRTSIHVTMYIVHGWSLRLSGWTVINVDAMPNLFSFGHDQVQVHIVIILECWKMSVCHIQSLATSFLSLTTPLASLLSLIV